MNRGSKIEQPFTYAAPDARAPGAATAQRDAILRAAARLFRERGFADTGMRDIAEAADLSAANLYHYFDGKDELLFYCQDRALDRMLDAVAAARRRVGVGGRTPARSCSPRTCRRCSTTSKAPPRTCRSSRCRRRCATRSSRSAIATSRRCAG